MIVTVNRKSQLTVCATSSGTVQGDDIDWREGSSGRRSYTVSLQAVAYSPDVRSLATVGAAPHETGLQRCEPEAYVSGRPAAACCPTEHPVE
jgi:hypothetical protein